MRRLLRALTKLGLLGAVAAAVYRLVQRRSSRSAADPSPAPWPPLTVPEEAPPVAASNGAAPSPAEEPVLVAAEPTATWVEPDGFACPASHPVKAKLASGVFHLPGMLHYDRTRPDRCYPDAEAAEADGLRKAKR